MQFVPQTVDADLGVSVFRSGAPFALCADDTKCLSDTASNFDWNNGDALTITMMSATALLYPTASYFTFNKATFQIQFLEKPTMCLDAPPTAGASWRVSQCGAVGSGKQTFTYSPFGQLVFDSDATQCMTQDATTGTVSTATCASAKATLQKLTIVPMTKPPNDAVPLASVATAAATTAATTFAGTTAFLIRSVRNTGLCLDDGGGALSTATFKLAVCDPTLATTQQKFVVTSGNEIRSVGSTSLCIGLAANSLELTYRTCGSGKGLYLSFDAGSFQMRRTPDWLNPNPLPPYCLTDTLDTWSPASAALAAQGNAKLALCGSINPSQQFPARGRAGVGAPLIAAAWRSSTTFSMCTGDTSLSLSDADGLLLPLPTSNGNALTLFEMDDLPFPTAAQFVYDATSLQIKSFEKPSACVEAPAAGAWERQMCVPTETNQNFLYNEIVQALSPWGTRSQCLDLAAGITDASDTVARADCTFDGPDANQTVVLVVAPTPPTISTASVPKLDPDVVLTAVAAVAISAPATTSAASRIRSLTKTELCLDDGGSVASDGTAVISLKQCDDTAPTQKFELLLATNEVRRVGSASQCLSLASTNLELTYQLCGTHPLKLAFDAATFQFKRPAERVGTRPFCLQDTTATPWATSEAGIKLAPCDTTRVDQRCLSQVFALPVRTVALNTKDKWTLCAAATPTQCLSDTTGLLTTTPNTPLKMLAPTALPSVSATQFTYDKLTWRVQSADKPGLCVEAPSPTGAWVLNICSITSANQRFVYNSNTRVLARVDSRNLGLDSSIGKPSNTGTVSTATCQLVGDTNQQFVVTPVTPTTLSTGTPTTLATVARAVFQTQPFVLRALYKTDLCMDDGGSTASTGTAKITLALCAQSTSQRFIRRPSTGEIQSASKPTLCLSLTAGGFGLTYRTCGSQRLPLSFSANSFQLQRTYATSVYCVQDTTASPWFGSSLAGQLQLTECNAARVSQRCLAQSLATPTLPPLFHTQATFTVCLAATGTTCLSDGAAATSSASGVKLRMMAKAAPMYRGANTFVYERATNRIQSVLKPALCIEALGAAPWTLAACNATSTNQRFVYNSYTKLLARFNGRDKCMDTALGDVLRSGVVATTACAGDGKDTQMVVLAGAETL